MAKGWLAGWWNTLAPGAGGRVLVMFVIAPLVPIAILVPAILNIEPYWQAARGPGVHGTLTVTDAECGQDGCVPAGPFVSDDRSVTLSRAVMHAPPSGWQAEDRLRAFYPDDQGSAEVYREIGGKDWLRLGFLLALSLFGIGAYLRLALMALADKRRRRAERAR